MSTNSLKRDTERMRRKWAVWEKPWLQYWRLQQAFTRASTDVYLEFIVQLRLNIAFPKNEDGQELPDLDHAIARTNLENEMRADFWDTTKPRQINRERREQLPKLANRLRKECRGDHRGITKRLHQAYQFTAHDDVYLENLKRIFALPSSDPHHGEPGHEEKQEISWSKIASGNNLFCFLEGYMCPISYPSEIEKDVLETLRLFITIEEKTMNELITAEYLKEKIRQIIEIIKNDGSDWSECKEYFEQIEKSMV